MTEREERAVAALANIVIFTVKAVKLARKWCSCTRAGRICTRAVADGLAANLLVYGLWLLAGGR